MIKGGTFVMKRFIIILITMGLVLVGCHLDGKNSNGENLNSTKQRVYSNSWDGHSIIVKQNSKVINEITNKDEVKKLIKALKNADWEENVEVDIRPPDYYFSWNSFKHSIWINKEFKRLE